MAADTSMVMGWDEAIENDGEELKYVILDEGDYDFTVKDFERARFNGSEKIAPSPMANLTLEVRTEEGIATCRTSLILNKVLEWKIASFFRSIGQKKHGEKLVPNWNNVIGAQGRAHFAPRTYTGQDGSLKSANDCKRFYDYDPARYGSTQGLVNEGFMKVPDAADNTEGIPFN